MPIISHQTPKTEQPFKTANADQLFPHQLSTLYELKRLEDERQATIEEDHPSYAVLRNNWFHHCQIQGVLKLQTQMGILASPTGTGKTHPMVALSMTPYTGGQHLSKSVEINSQLTVVGQARGHNNKFIPSTLIIVPKNIYFQWMRVIKQAGVSYHDVYNREDLDDLIKIIDNPALEKPKIVLVKHTLYNELATAKSYWSRVVLDEADTINIPASRRVVAGFTWLVSATAEYLHAHPHKGYWRDITRGISIPLLKALEITIDQDYAIECLHGAQINKYNILCQGINNMREVTQFLPRRIQEMLAAGDYNSAVKELGGQMHNTETLTDLIVKYFETRIESTRENIREAVMLEHKHDALDQRLRDLLERKETIIEQIKKVSGSCAICHDESTDISLVQCCFQVFCTECILAWMGMRVGQSCPYCKGENPVVLKINTGVKREEPSESKTEPDDPLSREAKYNKYQTLPILIDHIFQVDPKSKIIVVTSYNMHAFQQQLENNRYQFNVLNHVSHRKTIQEYNAGVSPIILLDAKYNGAGIDLEQTTDIIYMQQLEPNLMKQTQGRALRLSRPMNLVLRIFYLETENQPAEQYDPIDRFIGLKRLALARAVIESDPMRQLIIPRPVIKIKLKPPPFKPPTIKLPNKVV